MGYMVVGTRIMGYGHGCRNMGVDDVKNTAYMSKLVYNVQVYSCTCIHD